MWDRISRSDPKPKEDDKYIYHHGMLKILKLKNGFRGLWNPLSF